MSRFDLNLSTRPFPAYRLAGLALWTLCIALIAASAWQGYSFFQYSSQARDIKDTERDARADNQALGLQVNELSAKLNRPDAAAKLVEIEFLNTLIAKGHFSWTGVFASLENLLPSSVHLNSLKPELDGTGGLLLRIEVTGHSISDVAGMIQKLQDSPAFGKVTVSAEQKQGGTGNSDVDVVLTVPYSPER